MADASLAPIYERLNGAGGYHPMTADTFADWAMEAGDLITVSRGQDAYTSPVSTSRLIWRGQHEMRIDSTGSREREAISKRSKRKFSGGGGAAMVNNNYIYHEITDEDGILKTTIAATESVIMTEVSNGYEGLTSRISQTASSIQLTVDNNYSGLSSSITQTASSISSVVSNNYSGLSSQITQTSSSISSVISNNYAGLSSTIVQEVDRLEHMIVQGDGNVVYPQFDDPTIDNEVKEGDVWVQTTGIQSWDDLLDADISWDSDVYNWDELKGSVVYVYRKDGETGRWEEVVNDREIATMTDIDQTNDHIQLTARAIETLDGEIRATEAQFEVRAQQIESTVVDKTNNLDTRITQTTSSIESQVNNSYRGLSSTITQTASSIQMTVTNNYEGLSSQITQTASSISSVVSSNYNGLSSAITQTASSISSVVSSNYNGLSTRITQTSSSISSVVSNNYSGLSTRITQTSSSISTVVSNNYSGLSTRIQQTESAITLKADRIELEGYVQASQLATSIAAITVLNAQAILATGLGVTGDTGINGNLNVSGSISAASGLSLNNVSVGTGINALQIVRSGNTYTLQKKHINDPNWTNVGTFSRATALTGAWGSGGTGVFTVNASPQGESLTTSVTAGAPTWSGTTATIPIKATVGTSATLYDVRTASVNVSSKLQSKTVTSNQTVTPDSGYVGLSSVVVNVSSGGGTIDIPSGQIYTTSGSPQGTQLTVLRNRYEQARADGDYVCFRVDCGETSKWYYMAP